MRDVARSTENHIRFAISRHSIVLVAKISALVPRPNRLRKLQPQSIFLAQTESRAAEVRATLNRANHDYYVLSQPTLSDSEYDTLLRELRDLEEKHPDLKSPDSPTHRVGAPPSQQFEPVQHPVPMLSLSNVTSEETFDAWYQRALDYLEINSADLTLELKIDGLAVAITYVDGVLTRAATRGDGTQGENITDNVRTIKSVPLTLIGDDVPGTIELRGEVYYPISAFDRLNEERESADLPRYVNPRNSASGSLRQLDSSETAKRPLDIFFYSIGYARNGEIPSSQFDCLKAMKRWGCKTNDWSRRVATAEEALAAIQNVAEIRPDLDFGIDGVVIKIDDITLQTRLGYVGRDPRWATAYKFPAEQAITNLLEIRTHVGRTGAINPYAVLEPVVVGGVTVSRATLHNEEDINRKDIQPGDRVIVQRAGDVIPQVVGPAPGNQRPDDSQPYRIEPNCPACGEPVVRDEDQADIRCINSTCPAQFERLLEHFASRGAMDIEGLGEKLAKELARQNLVTNIAEIYTLHERMDDLLAMERMGEKRAQNLVDAIEQSKSQPLPRLIFGVGIIGVGSEIAETLSREFRDLSNLLKADAENLTAIEGIGPILANSIREWTLHEPNIALVQRLKDLGVDPVDDSPEPAADHPVKGLTFVITGKLESFSRTEAANAVKALGAKASGSVSKNTDYLVAGADAGSKLETAVRLNVPVLNEDQFKDILNGKLPDPAETTAEEPAQLL